MIRRFLLLIVTVLIGTVPAMAQTRPAAPNYARMVSITPQGAFVLGNPRAKVRLVEYLSYTCSHCAHFTETAVPSLKRDYVAKGLVAYEVRNLIRDPFDLAAALLARCGGPSRVFQLTDDIMARQEVWMAEAQVVALKQESQLKAMPLARQLQTIAKGTGLLDLALARGVTPQQANVCLASDQMNKTVLAMTKDAVDVRKLNSTPSFLINDQPGPRSSNWGDVEAAIRTVLDAR